MYSDKPAAGNTMALAQIIKEEIKKEIIDELLFRQGYCLAPEPRWRGVENTGGEWRGWPGSTIIMEDQPGIINDLSAGDAEKIPLNRGPDSTYFMGLETAGESGNPLGERGKEIIYGIGAVALLGVFLPSFRQKMQTILARAASEGVDLIGKARSIVVRAKEDMEDLIAEANLKELMRKTRQ
ncbi:MAG: hypothetical protein GX989_04815 [Firmicutes bacterium]|nr:hypothetical protein [Bacillota bacterium]